MHIYRFCVISISLLILVEIGLGVWRNTAISVSADSLFSWPIAAQYFEQPGDLAGVIAVYQADRGAEVRLDVEDGSRITVLYFEWDRVEVGPMMGLASHAPDECNVAIGYTLQSVDSPRSFEGPIGSPLVFDSTRFTNPSGQTVYMFKMPWIQGLGTWELREGLSRTLRIQRSFVRHIGAARVLQAGVFGARDADHAWEVFQTEVLEKLEWR
jgi:hypothetical protein